MGLYPNRSIAYMIILLYILLKGVGLRSLVELLEYWEDILVQSNVGLVFV